MADELYSVIIYGAGNFFSHIPGKRRAVAGGGGLAPAGRRSRVKLLSYNTPGFEHSAIIQMLIAILGPSASLSSQPAFPHIPHSWIPIPRRSLLKLVKYIHV